MPLDRKLPVNGEIVYRTFVSEGEQMVSMVVPYGISGASVDLEFRVADFVAFGDHTADIASKLIDSTLSDRPASRDRSWFERWKGRWLNRP